VKTALRRQGRQQGGIGKDSALADLASRLRDTPVRRGDPPWPGHEYVRGSSVFGLPFDSGHVLELRVFPENDFSQYRTV